MHSQKVRTLALSLSVALATLASAGESRASGVVRQRVIVRGDPGCHTPPTQVVGVAGPVLRRQVVLPAYSQQVVQPVSAQPVLLPQQDAYGVAPVQTAQTVVRQQVVQPAYGQQVVAPVPGQQVQVTQQDACPVAPAQLTQPTYAQAVAQPALTQQVLQPVYSQQVLRAGYFQPVLLQQDAVGYATTAVAVPAYGGLRLEVGAPAPAHHFHLRARVRGRF
jgi:hypothetical protein